MLILIADQVINTDHIVRATWQEVNTGNAEQSPHLVINLSNNTSVSFIQKNAQKVWDYLLSEAKEL